MEGVGYDNSLGLFLLVLAAAGIGGLIRWGRGERRPYESPATRMAEGAARRAAEFAEHDDYAQQRRGLGILEAEDHDALMHCFSRAVIDLGEDAPWEERKALAWKQTWKARTPSASSLSTTDRGGKHVANTPTLRELRSMTNEELEYRYDQHAENTVIGLDWYVGEVRRRDADRHDRRIYWLSVTVAISAVAQVFVAIVSLST